MNNKKKVTPKVLALSHSELKRRLIYDPDTGDFIRTEEAGYKPGSIAGSIHRTMKTYKCLEIHLSINKKPYLFKAHRLAYFYMTGIWPDKIDHINGDALDNSWKNLRNTNYLGNQRNQKMPITNTSGVVGVSFRETVNKWYAYIQVKGKTIALGTYEEFEDAVKVRKQAEKKYGFHSNHGQKR